jgi:WhiB family redox-sensing transcriptional regulator
MNEAKAICWGKYDGRPCPLLSQCLEFALVNNERFGVWGGTTPEERRGIRKERREEKAWREAGDLSSQVA